MKKTIAILLAVCLCIGLCACGGNVNDDTGNTEVTKSLAAQKADELILAIGEVSSDSEPAILAAQAYYDTLTDEEKVQVENYDVLLQAAELLPKMKSEEQRQIAIDLMEQGDYIQASGILYENADISQYAELVKECGQGVMPQYIRSNGEEKETGKYFLNLTNSDGLQISVWYFEESNAIQYLYHYSGNGVMDLMMVDYTIGSNEMKFTRSTMNLGMPVNYQEGTVSVSEYAGTFTGSLADNSSEPLIIHGLTVTSFDTAYEKQTRGYQTATMRYINEMLDAMFAAVAQAGYKGTMNDIGFTAYKSE